VTNGDVADPGCDQEQVCDGEEEEDEDELAHERIGDRVICFEIIPKDLIPVRDALSLLQILGAAVDRGPLEFVDSQGLEGPADEGNVRNPIRDHRQGGDIAEEGEDEKGVGG
jgi:hypothetical protein